MAKFKRGQSGNPGGRPRGSATVTIRALSDFVTDDDMREVFASVVGAAKSGDIQAAALLLDRTIPKLKPQGSPELEGAIAGARRQAMLAGGGLTLEELLVGVVTSTAEPLPPREVIAPPGYMSPQLPAQAPAVRTEPAVAPVEPRPAPAFRMPLQPPVPDRKASDYDSTSRWLD